MRYKLGHRVHDDIDADLIFIARLKQHPRWCVVFDIHSELMYPTLLKSLHFHERRDVFRKDKIFLAHIRKLWNMQRTDILNDMERIVSGVLNTQDTSHTS